jgi:hypothetical protein
MTAPNTKDAQFAAIGQQSWTPSALYDREPRDWLGETPVCRKILFDMVQSELKALREREHVLRTNYETPARDSAELRRQVLTTPEGTLLLRHARTHEQTFQRAYAAMIKGWSQSLKTGLPPGAPIAGGDRPAHQQADAAAARESDREAVAEAQARRKRAAEAVAPGAGNGIGAPAANADGMVTVIMAARAEELACEAAAQAPPETPAQAG